MAAQPVERKDVLSVIMPVFNEDRTLRAIIGKVLLATTRVDIELIIVDDGSTDESKEIIREVASQNKNVRFFFQNSNQGKSAAVRKGIELASGNWILIQDADLEYDPAEYDRLLAPALEGHADAVFGSRFSASASRRVLYFWHSIANHALTAITNLLFDLTLTDMETCYKLVRADVLKQIPLKGNGFTFEPELAARLAQWGARIFEVPVSYRGRTYAEGKYIRAVDAVWALFTLFYCRFINRRFSNDEGYYILHSMSKARGFNVWLLKQLDQYIGERVLEAGCGIGNLTQLLLRKKRLVAIDNEKRYVDALAWNYGHLANIRPAKIDITQSLQVTGLKEEKLDTVLCLNVLEHVKDDMAVLNNFWKVLEPGGTAVVLVPQFPWLYTPVDSALGHHHRYSRNELKEKMTQAGFEVIGVKSFNRLGALGWLVNGKIFRKKSISPFQTQLFELALPLAKAFELLRFMPGLSIIGIGRKPKT